MIVLKAQGIKILQVEPNGEEILYAVCAEPEKAIRLMYRGWTLNAQRHYTAAARKFYDVEQLPGFAWSEITVATGDLRDSL